MKLVMHARSAWGFSGVPASVRRHGRKLRPLRLGALVDAPDLVPSSTLPPAAIS